MSIKGSASSLLGQSIRGGDVNTLGYVDPYQNTHGMGIVMTNAVVGSQTFSAGQLLGSTG